MRYLSVCSGIEAVSQAWHPLGWEPFAFSEIEKFPSAVLAYHYPDIPNLGDMTKFKEWPDADIDVLVGGTPCQSFSVAGLRKGLDDPRGNLMLTYLAIAAKYRPEWLVWENVPGVLSSNEGRDFGSLLGGMAKLGYGFAYRVLDAQYVRVQSHPRAIPQRRRRVFVVGYLGDWRRAAAVLFERESLQRHIAPRREAGKGFAADVVSSLTASGRGVERTGETQGQDPVIVHAPAVSLPIKACDCKGVSSVGDGAPILGVSHSLRGEGFDASEDGTGRGTPIVPTYVAYGFPGNWIGRKPENGSNQSMPNDNHSPCLTKTDVHGVSHGMQVRRLTPTECERLQGFPDGYTAIPWRGKPADQCPDGPRYKALGNSMAVNVMRWIGGQIAMVDEIKIKQKARS